MTTTHGNATHVTTGSMASSEIIPPTEVREYERILKLSDEIFSGTHPRLKVPQHVLRKPGARLGQNGASTPVAAKGNLGKPVVDVPSQTLPAPYSSQAPVSRNSPFPPSSNAPSTRAAPKPTSEINPILLTKSDDLVRAELGLQRQRVERTLREQLDMRKQESKQKPSAQDTKPDFDVSEVLNKALDIVRPVSLNDPSEAAGQNDSFDDNSYYSSKAPDSPPTRDHQTASPVSPAAAPPPDPAVMEIYNEVQQRVKEAGGQSQEDIYAEVAQRIMELKRLEALNNSGAEQDEHADRAADLRVPHSQKHQHSSQAENPHHRHEVQQIEAPEEPEYSPPMSLAPPVITGEQSRGAVSNSSRTRPSSHVQDVYEPASPRNVRVIRNHITSPAAPRPSRVSPLAMPKVPSVNRHGEQPVYGSERVYSDSESGRATPSGPVSQLMPRKRRRLQDRGEDAQSASKSKTNAEHATAYIKTEPVSPPPFADDPALRVQPQARPLFIDVESPHYAPVLERPEVSGRAPVYDVESYHDAPVVQGPSRTVSRVSSRRPPRDDSDLRRVASLQYARQADYPRGYVDVDQRDARSGSYLYVDRRLPEQPRYYEQVQPSHGPPYTPYEEYQRPVYHDPYYEEAPAQIVSAPPRRFVVDQNGIEYEMIPSQRSQAMAPPPRPMSRAPPPKGDVYDDRAPPRAPSVRAPSVVQDPYGDRRYVQEMPPPQPVYRRVASDFVRPVTSDRRAYAVPAEGHEPYSRSGSAQVPEYLSRRPTYVDEHGQPQERMIRTSSVRPGPARYEEPDVVVQRVGSAHPGGPSREVSIYMEDRPLGNYVEQPYYVRERPYYEPEDANRMALTGTEPVHRVQQHY